MTRHATLAPERREGARLPLAYYLDIQNVVHPEQLLKINFFFRFRIANIINPLTSTLLFDQKLLLYRIITFINTAVDFQDLKSICNQSYMRNCDF